MASPSYLPLLIGGRRDARRRFVETLTGQVISRRQYDEHVGRLKGTTQEAYARANAAATGGRSRIIEKTGKKVRIGPLQSNERARAFAQQRGIGVRAAQNTQAFRDAEAALREPRSGTKQEQEAQAVRRYDAAIKIYGGKAARQRYESLARYVGNLSREEA